MKRLGLLLLLAVVGCAPQPGANVDPARSSARLVARASRAEAISALSNSALELGLSVADANVGAGFWRTARFQLPRLPRRSGLPSGASGFEIELTAVVADVAPDSVRVTITGVFVLEHPRDRTLRFRRPIVRSDFEWIYVDGLAASTRGRLGVGPSDQR